MTLNELRGWRPALRQGTPFRGDELEFYQSDSGDQEREVTLPHRADDPVKNSSEYPLACLSPARYKLSISQ